MPQKALTWCAYSLAAVIILFHTIDTVLTLFAVTLGYAQEGNDITIFFMERMGIVFALFTLWVLGVVVAILILWVSKWFETKGYYYPIPTLSLILFLTFTAIIKVMTVVWNVMVIL